MSWRKLYADCIWLFYYCYLAIFYNIFSGKGLNDYVPLELTSGIVIYGNGTVFIPSPTATHEGVYSCQASNGVGPILKKDVFLTVNGKNLLFLITFFLYNKFVYSIMKLNTFYFGSEKFFSR